MHVHFTVRPTSGRPKGVKASMVQQEKQIFTLLVEAIELIGALPSRAFMESTSIWMFIFLFDLSSGRPQSVMPNMVKQAKHMCWMFGEEIVEIGALRASAFLARSSIWIFILRLDLARGRPQAVMGNRAKKDKQICWKLGEALVMIGPFS